MTDRIGNGLDAADGLLADFNFFGHEGLLADFDFFTGQRNRNGLVSTDRTANGTAGYGVTLDDELFVRDRNVDRLLLGDDLLADANGAARNANFINREPLGFELKRLIRRQLFIPSCALSPRRLLKPRPLPAQHLRNGRASRDPRHCAAGSPLLRKRARPL